MSKRKVKKRRTTSGKGGPKRKQKAKEQEKHRQRAKLVQTAAQMDVEQQERRERLCEIGFIAVLFAFGVYMSILYFGHTVVPISDFPDLYNVGRAILSLRLPVRFMQAPVLGMLQVALSYVVGGHDPNLTAGWLLNALLYPFNLVLLYLVAKRIVGKAALWLAVIAVLNPWVVYLLTEPIVETTYMFFILLSLYFMFRRSRWCYVFASITTMVRYEGAALIFAAFLWDMIEARDNRQRAKAFGYSVLASVPLGLWMLGTYLTWSPDTLHYFNVWGKGYEKGFKESTANRTGIGLHLRLLWHVGFRPLLASITDVKASFRLITPTAGDVGAIQGLYTASKVIVAAGAMFGAIYGLVKRNLKIVALLIFFVPYFILHAFYPYPLQRFHTTIFWIALVIFWFGLQGIWGLVNGSGRVPRGVVIILQGVVAAIAFVWVVFLFPYLWKVSSISPRSASVPYVAIAVIAAVFGVRIYLYRTGGLWREVSVLALVCLAIVSSQFRLVPLVNDGQKEAEFKELAEWYAANAEEGEKMAVYMAGVVRMFAPEHAEYITKPPIAGSPAEFDQACYREGFTYVVWATREGLSNDHWGYRAYGLDKNMDRFRTPRSVGPYEFVDQVSSRRGYVNIFRLREGRATKGEDKKAD